MRRITLLKLAAVCYISSAVPSATALSAAKQTAQSISLLPRANSCSLPGYDPCNKVGLPSNFCCPSNTKCVAFNNDKSAICCPAGKDCSTISTISCDITQQNATLHPASELFSTDLSIKMASCGNLCCPNGFRCDGGSKCTAAPPISTSASSSSTTAWSSTPTPSQKTTISSSSSVSATNSGSSQSSATPTVTSSASTNISAAKAHCTQFPAAGVLVGFFGGLIAGIIITVVLGCFLGHRDRQKDQSPSSPNLSNHIAAQVSDPFYPAEGGAAFRSDFLRPRMSRQSKIRSFMSRSSTTRTRSGPVDGIGRTIPKTPVNQRSPSLRMKHEPSMESIGMIYSPGKGEVARPGTTFTDMMTEVGFRPGEPYLGNPGRVDPRSRGIGG